MQKILKNIFSTKCPLFYTNFTIFAQSITKTLFKRLNIMGFLQNFKAFAMKSNVIGAITGEERQRT